MEKPRISVVVATFNHGSFIAQALQSIIDQTYTDWECIIIDDGSTDKTSNIVSNWTKKDSRFKYIKQANQGVVNARNKGIYLAEGEFILPLDADDLIGDLYLEEALKVYDEKPQLKLVYCKARKFGEVNEDWQRPEFSLKNLAMGNFIFNSAVFKKEDWEKIGGYDYNLAAGYEDWDFWISLLKDGGEAFEIPQIGFFYRIKESSRNSDITEDQFQEIFTYLSTKHVDFFVEHLGSFQSLLFEIRQLKNVNKSLNKDLKKIQKNRLLKLLERVKLIRLSK